MSNADVPHAPRDQDLSAAAANGGTYPSNHATEMLEQQYSNLSMYNQSQPHQQQHKTGASSLLTPNSAPSMASYPQPQYNTSPPYPTALAADAQYGFFDQHQQYQQQQQPLPEDAPAPKTDPVELSLLASYLEVVRQTQGDAAAAEAMAASGADAATLGNAISSSPSHAAAEASWPPAAAAAALGTTSPPTAATAEDNLAVNNLLGFIKQRKLTGLPQMPTSRRNSSGGASTASSTTGAAGGASQTQQGTAAGGRKIWIQPSGKHIESILQLALLVLMLTSSPACLLKATTATSAATITSMVCSRLSTGVVGCLLWGSLCNQGCCACVCPLLLLSLQLLLPALMLTSSIFRAISCSNIIRDRQVAIAVYVAPPGPRRPGEGVENEEQGILSAEEVSATG